MMFRPISCGFIGVVRDYFVPGSAAALFSFAVLFAVTDTAHAEWISDAEFSAVYESNVNRAIAGRDRKSDVALMPAVSFGYYAQLADSIGLAVSADLKYNGFARFSGLDHLESGLTASLKYKWGLGSYAPWVKVFGSGAHMDYREDFRDEDLVRSGFLSGKRINERISAQIGYAYESGSARDSRFDTRNSVVSMKIDYLLTESVQTWIGYAWGRGVYIANLPFAFAGGSSVPRADIVNTFKEPMRAFQLHADAQILSFGASKVLTSHWSADISADFVDIFGNGRHYPDSLYKAGIVYAY
jgi:hypothetical protein